MTMDEIPNFLYNIPKYDQNMGRNGEGGRSGMPGIRALIHTVTDETMMESEQHGSAGFPFQYYYENIWDFDFHRVDWHWHPELEMVYVKTGVAICRIGETVRDVPAGGGFLINSKVMHCLEAEGDTVIPNAVFSPVLLAPEDSLVASKYVTPYLSGGPECLYLLPSVPWQARCLEIMCALFDIQGSGEREELRTVQLLLTFWEEMMAHISLCERAVPDISLRRLQIMMQYIQEHYKEEIRLEDIAGAVFVGKSTALDIFSRCIHQSPVSYLIDYRLSQAAKLLMRTEKRVADISEETGFQSIEYFCRAFRKRYGMTPQSYRKEKRTEE